MTTAHEIGVWFDRGIALGASHMIVATDTFDHDDYPVYGLADPDYPDDTAPDQTEQVVRARSARDIAALFDGKNMQKVMEVYNLTMSKAEQLAAPRVFNY